MAVCIKCFLRMKRALLLFLTALAVKIGIFAEEKYNVPVVEYFERVEGRTGLAYIGVDTSEPPNDLADVFIIILNTQAPFGRRVADRIKAAGSVSYEDNDKLMSPSLGAYAVGIRAILEIGGKSVLEIFPGQELSFVLEVARQERLKREAAERPVTPAQSSDALTPEEQRLLLELLRKQQGSN